MNAINISLRFQTFSRRDTEHFNHDSNISSPPPSSKMDPPDGKRRKEEEESAAGDSCEGFHERAAAASADNVDKNPAPDAIKLLTFKHTIGYNRDGEIIEEKVEKRTPTGKSVLVDREAAAMSTTLKTMFEVHGENGFENNCEVELPKVDAEVLEMVRD
jgi:hypothetical protein